MGRVPGNHAGIEPMKAAQRARTKQRPRDRKNAPPDGIDSFRAQHLDLAPREIMPKTGAISVLVNDGESPLAWLARRKGRDGRTMISPNQFIAGEKLRADFTRGHLSPRVTSDWSAPSGRSRTFGGGAGELTGLVIASRQSVRRGVGGCWA